MSLLQIMLEEIPPTQFGGIELEVQIHKKIKYNFNVFFFYSIFNQIKKSRLQVTGIEQQQTGGHPNNKAQTKNIVQIQG
jgi:hypothetical protein